MYPTATVNFHYRSLSSVTTRLVIRVFRTSSAGCLQVQNFSRKLRHTIQPESLTRPSTKMLNGSLHDPGNVPICHAGPACDEIKSI
jgi:hypothetical protein